MRYHFTEQVNRRRRWLFFCFSFLQSICSCNNFQTVAHTASHNLSCVNVYSIFRTFPRPAFLRRRLSFCWLASSLSLSVSPESGNETNVPCRRKNLQRFTLESFVQLRSCPALVQGMLSTPLLTPSISPSTAHLLSYVHLETLLDLLATFSSPLLWRDKLQGTACLRNYYKDTRERGCRGKEDIGLGLPKNVSRKVSSK